MSAARVVPARREQAWAAAAAGALAASVAARAANLAAVVLCARILPQESFGQLAVVQSTAGMFAPLASLGLAMSTTKFVAEYRDRDPERAGRILGLSLMGAGAAGLLMTLVFVAAAPWIATAGLGAPAMAGLLEFAAAMLLFGVLESVITGALTGLGGFGRLAQAGLWSGVASIPVVGLLAWTAGTRGAIAGLTAGIALSCACNGWFLWRECRNQGVAVTLRGAWRERRLLTSFSVPAYLSGLVMAPVAWSGNAMLAQSSSAGLAQLAWFSAADRYRSVLVFAPLAISRTAVPALARFHAAGDRQGYGQALRWNLTVSLVAVAIPACLCAVLAPLAMSVFGEPFRAGGTVLAILSLSAIPAVLNTQLGAALLASGRPWARAFADLLLAAVFVGAGWLWIPRGGAAALSAANLLAYAAACLMLAILIFGKKKEAAGHAG